MNDLLKKAKNGTLLVGWDVSRGTHNTLLIVGETKKGAGFNVLGAFEGEDAYALLSMLLERKDKVQ